MPCPPLAWLRTFRSATVTFILALVEKASLHLGVARLGLTARNLTGGLFVVTKVWQPTAIVCAAKR
jgi:hypothetical protein